MALRDESTGEELMHYIYIASPFFTPAQKTTLDYIESILATHGVTFFSPRHHGILNEMAPEDRAKAMQSVFDMNVQGIDKCEIVLAVVDHKDTGTIWEMGYAYGKGIDVITAAWSASSVNLMLSKGTMGHVELGNLVEFAQTIKDGNSLWKCPFIKKLGVSE
jgi:nucleoside 2-deoxyribosyltransferase